MANFLPVALNIKNKKILIIGGGNVAFKKVMILIRYTKNITIIAEKISEKLKKMCPYLCLREKRFENKDLEGYQIIYCCTNSKTLNKRMYNLAKKSGNFLVNVCDNKKDTDFISPAIFKYRNFSIAVTSDGFNVKRSIKIRDKIKEIWKDVFV